MNPAARAFHVFAAIAHLACLGLAAASDPGVVAGGYGASLGAGAATAAERLATGQNPAAFTPDRLGFSLHAHRPFGMGDLLVAEAGAGRDGRYGGCGAAWRQVRVGEVHLRQTWEIQGARRFRPEWPGFPGSLDAGSAIAASRSATAGRAAAWDFRQAHGAIWRPVPAFGIGAFARDLPVSAGKFAGWEAALIRQVGMEARAPRPVGGVSQSLRFDLRKTGYGDWRSLASLSLAPHPAFEATAGIASAPFRFSLGLRAAWGGMAAWQAFRHHGALGPTWLSSLAWEDAPGD